MANVLSIVVARKGSKGLPGKCMLPINGLPVVEHVIKWSDALSRPDVEVKTVVSTDIIELEPICHKYNADFILRKDELTGDTVRIEDVIFNAAEVIEGNWDYLSLLYGNVPIRYDSIFHGAVEFLEENNEFDSVLSFQSVEKFHPSWMVALSSDRLPEWKEQKYRRQDLTPYMVHDGHTCITRSNYFINHRRNKNMNRKGMMYESFGKIIKPWLNEEFIVDIDTEKDYQIAKALLISEP